MAEQPALPQVHGIRMRVALLDQNGVPTPGASSLYTTDAYTKVGLSPVYTDGNEIEVQNAQGVTCVRYRSSDTLKRADIDIELCSVDPYLVAMLTGGSLLTTTAPIKTGLALPRLGEVSGNGVSIEVWSRRVDDGEEDVDSPYAWWVYPRVKNLRIGDYAHEANALLPTITGQAYENPNWFDGPLNDWPSTSTSYGQYIPTVTLPAVAVGYTTLAAS